MIVIPYFLFSFLKDESFKPELLVTLPKASSCKSQAR